VRYAWVPAEIHRRLMRASSPASFFRDNIDGDFPATRVHWQLVGVRLDKLLSWTTHCQRT